jgi:hypothetical protein
MMFVNRDVSYPQSVDYGSIVVSSEVPPLFLYQRVINRKARILTTVVRETPFRTDPLISLKVERKERILRCLSDRISFS